MSPIRSGLLAALLAAAAIPAGQGVLAGELVMQPAINGQSRGYVFTRFALVQPRTDLQVDCPDGVAMSLRDSFIALLPPADRARAEQFKGFGPVSQLIQATVDPRTGLKLPPTREELARMPEAERTRFVLRDRSPDHYNMCNFPADFDHVGFRTIEHAGPSTGLNLDSTPDGAATRTTCAHTKFTGPDGTAVDNQVMRALGCIAAYRPGGNEWDSTIRSGEWAVLMELTPVSGGEEFEVNLYSSRDGVIVNGAGKIQPGLSLEYIDDPQLIARTRGTIENGVLTTRPVAFTFKYDNQIIHNRRSFEAVQFRLQLRPDGSLQGHMGAYADVDAFYDETIRPQTLTGAVANAINCPALYASLHALADGHRDPKTGLCSAISLALDVEAVPAFVIHPRHRTADATARGRQQQ